MKKLFVLLAIVAVSASGALSTLAILEGAFLLSRALRTMEPMRAAADSAAALISAALEAT